MDGPDIAHVQGVGYIVRSASVPGAWRLVVGKTCSCPAGGRRSCRHRKAVDAFVRERNERSRRPSPPPHISALVD